MHKHCAAIFLLLLLSFSCAGQANAIDPYDAVALSQGWVLSTYLSYYSAPKYLDKNGDVIPAALNLKAYETTLRLTGYNKSILPNTLGVTLLAPAGRMDVRGDHTIALGDISLAAGYWFIDNPLTKTYLVAGLYIDIPTGPYNMRNTANMGANVWKFRPTVGYAQQWGGLKVEAAVKYNIYSKNTDTQVKNGSELITELYSGYFILPYLLFGANINGTFGQDSTARGIQIDDSGVQRLQAGPSLYLVTGKRSSITFVALSEFDVRNSARGNLLYTRFVLRF
ncbi:MAG: transporter [Nitrospirae bacterium]|nr:transporter [Nitrospirota bacterium]